MAGRLIGAKVWPSIGPTHNGSNLGLYYIIFWVHAELGTNDAFTSFSRHLRSWLASGVHSSTSSVVSAL